MNDALIRRPIATLATVTAVAALAACTSSGPGAASPQSPSTTPTTASATPSTSPSATPPSSPSTSPSAKPLGEIKAVNCGPKVAFWTAQPVGSGVVVTVLLRGETEVEIKVFGAAKQVLANKMGGIPSEAASAIVPIAVDAAQVAKILIIAGGEQYAVCYAQRRTG